MKIHKIYDFNLFHKDENIKKVINHLNQSVHKIIFVCNSENELVGSLTDGDLRRSILKGIDLNSSIEMVMNKTPFYLETEDILNLNEERIKNYGFNHIPVLKNRKIQYVIFYDYNFQKKSTIKSKVIIMAGGKGTRLLPLTKVIPKPLVPFNNKTIIENIMDQFVDSGYDEYIVTLNYKAEMIIEYLKNLEYDVSYIVEDKFLGTAGGIKLLDEKIISEPFFVSNCDILLNVDFYEAMESHKKNEVDITIFGSLENIDISYGILESAEDGEFERIKEKPNLSYLVNTGIYILNPTVIDLVNDRESIDMPDLINRAKKRGMKVKVFPVPNQMTDIGQWKFYKNYL